MPLVSSAKSLWRRTVQSRSNPPSTPLSHSPMVLGEHTDTEPDFSQAVTLAIVGCGQRGKVRLVILLKSVLHHNSIAGLR